MIQFAVHILLTAALLAVVASLATGIAVKGGSAAIFGAVVLGFANGIVRPILLLLTFPITVVTLGLFKWVVNAFMLKLTAALVPGFRVDGFGSAMMGSLLLGLLNLGVAFLFGMSL